MAPEEGTGEKNRKIKFQAGPGGLECDGSTKDTCSEPCPGSPINRLMVEYRNGICKDFISFTRVYIVYI